MEKFSDLIFLLFGIAGAVVVYWWRRRTRLPQMNLTQGTERLSKMVEKGDKPDPDDVLDLMTK
jgi:hypothetical protein